MSQFRSFVRRTVVLADYTIGWLLVATIIINGAAVFMRYVMLDSDLLERRSDPLSRRLDHVSRRGERQLGRRAYGHEHARARSGARDSRLGTARCFRLSPAPSGSSSAWQGVRYTMLSGMQTAPTTGVPMYYVYSAIASAACSSRWWRSSRSPTGSVRRPIRRTRGSRAAQ